ncbi:transglutaminase-like putative cysteine protease [Pseudomonas sp. TE6283]
MFMSYLAPLAGVLAFTLACIAPAQARDDGTDHSVTLEKVVQTFTVQRDGSFQVTVESVSRINEERAIQAKAQQALSYNRGYETLEVDQAFTQKPDGRKVMVDASQIKEQQEQASTYAPMFQDSRVKVVIFPEVAVGDRLVLRYKRHRTTALFPGHFEDLTAAEFHPVEQFSLIYDLPADLPLYADARGFKASTPKAGKGRKVYRWDFVPTDRARIEASAVSYLDYGQYLAVSTFKDYAGLAASYQARADVQVTPAIAALAGQLTANLPDARAKALKLSDWVRENIRYVAVYVGAGGVVPHAAQSVLDNRYGDCKDHVALLEALLKAAGIESSPALINLGNAYQLPKVPTLGVLNHVLTYVPSLDLYLDSTDPSVAAGYLPLMDLDKTTLLTATGVFGKTPATQFGKQVGEMLFKVKDTGAADFTGDSTIEGWASEVNRYGAKTMKPTDLDRIVEQVLNAYGQRGSGKILIQPSAAPEHFRSQVQGHTENLVNLPGPVGVPALSSLVGGIAQSVYGFATENERTQGFVCISNETLEQSRFEFPAGVTVLATPKAVAVKEGSFDYSARYTRDGNAVVVERRMQFKHPKAVCTPEEFKAMKPVIETMVRDLQGQIIVQG